MTDTSSTLDTVFVRLVTDDEGRACRDIPDSACREEPRNFFTHVLSLFLSKSADGLIDPKLVLSWLLTSLGAPAYLIGLLVPVRESGALLPQLFTAGAIRKLAKRKYVWAAGSVGQGLSAIGMGLAALLLEGPHVGFAIVGLLTCLAISRSACSVSYKDVLGKTVSKSRRGTATGLAGSVSSAIVILFALLLTLDFFPRYDVVIAALFMAGGCWILGALIFLTLQEEAGATDGGQSSISAAIKNLSLLRTDKQLRVFILSRALLTATALAPPFMVAAGAGDNQNSYTVLGFLIFASASAGLLSAYIWGRLADRSSRKVLIYSGVVSSIALFASAIANVFGYLHTAYVLPGLLFVLMIAYQGVRLGRSTHLVDMANEETRAAYTALSNTIIGVILLLGSAFSVIAHAFSPAAVLWPMAIMCALASLVSLRLNEVQ